MPKSKVNPDLELYQDHEPESVLAEEDCWLITEFTIGKVPGHSYIAFEGVAHTGDQWIWVCDFLAFDYEKYDQDGIIVLPQAIAGVPGLVRTTNPTYENKGGPEKGKIPLDYIFSEKLRLGPSHYVKIADAKRGQKLVNQDEENPPEYGLLGATSFFAPIVRRYNCAGWVRSIILTCGVSPNKADEGILIPGCESLPKKRDLRFRS